MAATTTTGAGTDHVGEEVVVAAVPMKKVAAGSSTEDGTSAPFVKAVGVVVVAAAFASPTNVGGVLIAHGTGAGRMDAVFDSSESIFKAKAELLVRAPNKAKGLLLFDAASVAATAVAVTAACMVDDSNIAGSPRVNVGVYVIKSAAFWRGSLQLLVCEKGDPNASGPTTTGIVAFGGVLLLLVRGPKVKGFADGVDALTSVSFPQGFVSLLKEANIAAAVVPLIGATRVVFDEEKGVLLLEVVVVVRGSAALDDVNRVTGGVP